MNELFFIRGVACLCVVFIHGISFTLLLYDQTPAQSEVFRSLQLVLMFATPLFVCLSELLLAHAYPDRIPAGFWKKRVRFVLIPYLTVGLIYTLLYYNTAWNEFGQRALEILVFGHWNGYFVLIIFQFYFLHQVLTRYLKNLPMLPVLAVSFGLNFAWLVGVTAAGKFGWVDRALLSLHKLPFPGWLFYFTIAYYIGRNLKEFRQWVAKKQRWIRFSFFASMIGVLLLKQTEVIRTVSSKRVDMLFYTPAALLFLFSLAGSMQRVPSLLVAVSRHSYGIYLWHPLVMLYLKDRWFAFYSLPLGITLLLYFFAGVFLSGGLTWLLNFTRWGPFFAGKTGPLPKGYRKEKKVASTA